MITLPGMPSLTLSPDSVRLVSKTYRATCGLDLTEQVQVFDPRCLSWVIGLLGHGAMESFDDYLAFVRKAGAGAAEDFWISRHLAAPDRRSCSAYIQSLARVAGVRAAMRSSGVRVRSENRFSANFLPPSASEANRAMRRLFAMHVQDRAGCKPALSQSLTFYMLFLTIHPLLDGNGRIARLAFASDRILADPWRATHEILALLYLHRDRGRLFHLAAKCMRAGDVGMLISCMNESLHDSLHELRYCINRLNEEVAKEQRAEVIERIGKDIHGMASCGFIRLFD